MTASRAQLYVKARAYLTLPALPEVELRYSDDQERDENGRFAGSGGGGGGGSSSSGGSGDAEIDSDPNVGENDEGDYGYGRDSGGVSYTENDVDDNGNPKFSTSYRDKYGPVTSDNQLGNSSLHLVDTEKGGIHIADDRHGTKGREVVKEMTSKQAVSLSDDVYEVNANGGSVTNRGTGVRVEARGGPNAEGYHATTVTFAPGASVDLSADDTFDLQEGLHMLSGETRSARRPTYGAAVLHPDARVRELVERALHLPDLPPVPHMRYSDDQERDEGGRFAGSGGGGGSSSSSGAGPTALHGGDEQAIKAAYDFHDEDVTGLRVETYAVRTGGPGQTTYVSAWIKDENGEIVGQAEHAIHPPGQHAARLDGLIVSPDYQGQGFGARYMRQVETQYRENGIDQISLTADIDVGGYSWAKDGYNFESHDSRSRVAGMAREEGRRFSPSVQREVRAVADDPESTPLEFAMIGYQEGASTWAGKQIMMGSSWQGVKKL